MRHEVIAAERDSEQRLHVQSLWHEGAEVITQVHHVLNEARAAQAGAIAEILDWKGALLESQFTRGEPIERIQKTTLNLQVGASADDGFWSMTTGVGSGYSASAARNFAGHTTGANDRLAAWHRFTGVSGLSGSTINTATFSLWGDAVDQGTPLTKIRAEDAAAPAAPTNLTEAQAIESNATTAGVDWDSPGLSTSAFTASPSIVSVIQELADSYDSTVIQIAHLDDSSGGGANNQVRPSSYDTATAEAAKLDIDFTAAAGGAVAAYYQLVNRRRRRGV